VYGSLIIDRYSVGVEGTVYNTESLPDMRWFSKDFFNITSVIVRCLMYI
jgi:hypothetical protein